MYTAGNKAAGYILNDKYINEVIRVQWSAIISHALYEALNWGCKGRVEYNGAVKGPAPQSAVSLSNSLILQPRAF